MRGSYLLTALRRRQRRITLAVLLALCLQPATMFQAEAPGWWASQGVINSNREADDFAALNQGQLKNLAKAAAAEMNVNFIGGAGAAIDSKIQAWESVTSSADDFAAVNLGQLKSVAATYYGRLIAVGEATAYPWEASSAPPDDLAVANIGQAKALFSFAVPDMWTPEGVRRQAWIAWLAAHQLPSTTTESGDEDQDGVSNLDEFLLGTHPGTADGDAVLQAWAERVAGSAAGTPSSEGMAPDQVGLRVYTPLR